MAGNRLKLVLSAIHSEKLTLQLLHYLSTPDQIRKLSAALYAHATPPGSEWITKAAFVSTLMVRDACLRVLLWSQATCTCLLRGSSPATCLIGGRHGNCLICACHVALQYLSRRI